MLVYLDALIAAVSVRDTVEVDRLLAHPLARILPAGARDEALKLGHGDCDPLAAPLRVMQLRHQTAELLRDAPVVADREEVREASERERTPRSSLPTMNRRPVRLVQMELPLSA